MKATGQYEVHPDAERLNAFAEQALGEGERSEVLRHLAECARCRQVVALAREAEAATAAEGVPPASRPVTIEPTAWWRRWRLVWIPSAALGAFAVASISFYVRQLEERGTNIRIAEQTPSQGTVPAPAASAANEAQAGPAPALPAAGAPRKKALKAEQPLAEGRQRAAEEALVPAPPTPEAMNSVFGNQMQAATSPAAGGAGASGGTPTAGKPAVFMPPAGAEWQAEDKAQALEKQQAQAAALHGQLFTAKALPANNRSASAPVPAAAETVEVSAAGTELETRTASAGTVGALEVRPENGLLAARRLSAIRLPSGLPGASFASAGSRMLAIDNAGALFYSEDDGRTWTRVVQQWTGRAVEVRVSPAANTGRGAAPAAQAEGTLKEPAEASPAPPAAPVFEILNDKGQAWWSTDGKFWIAK